MQNVKNAPVIYKPLKAKLFVLILCSLVFLITFAVNFPVEKNIRATLITAMRSIPNCPMSFSDLGLVYLPPGINLKNLKVPASCANTRSPMLFNDITVNLAGFDWVTLSPVFSFNTNYLKSNLKGLVSMSPSNLNLKLEDSLLNLKAIVPMLPIELDLQGAMNISSNIEISNNKLFNFQINAFSKNLKIGPTNIQILSLPGVNIGKFQIRARTPTSKKLIIEDLIVGEPSKPIHGFFKGDINLDQQNLANSKLDLTGQFKLSEQLMEELVIVKPLLTPFKKDDDYYHLKVGGTFKAPKPQKN